MEPLDFVIVVWFTVALSAVSVTSYLAGRAAAYRSTVKLLEQMVGGEAQ